MYYAKSNPKESIKEHTDKLLENLEELKEIYGNEILKEKGIEESRFWYLLEIICKYHDIGKTYTPFQNIIKTKIGEPYTKTEYNYEKIKHEQLSPAFLPIEKLNLTEEEKYLVYQSIYYHHERENKDIDEIYTKEILEKDIVPQIEKIKEELDLDIEEKMNLKYTKYTKKRIKEGDKLYIEYCLLKGLLHRLDHSSSGHMKVEDDTKEKVSKYTERYLEEKNYDKNELQEFTQENKDKNIVIIGSTGIGKTEAALLWSNNNKTFFTLPIRISINAIYDRIKEEIKYKNVGLLHSTALEYLEEKTEEENQINEYNQSKNLYNKIITCTIDQIFPFVFKYKGYEKIYSTLSYSKIIIDEIQAYSPEIVAILLKGIEMINKINGKFMIMTATLPRIYKEELEKRKIEFKFIEKTKEIQRHKIEIKEKSIEEDIKEIKEKSKTNKVLIIVNTVDKAIEIYNKFKQEKVKNINMLHARYIYQDRAEKEKSIKIFSKTQEKTGIWITTQIVEASLDIDFDLLYTEMSTLDSLFQRLGRCYRSREYTKQEPNIKIYLKDQSGIGSVYDKEINKKSEELLKKYNNQILEEKTKIELVDKLYSKENLEKTKFLRNFKETIEFLDNIIDYDINKEKAQKVLRNIETIKIIPKTVYEQNIKLFEEYEASKGDYKNQGELRRKINKLIINISQGQKNKIKERITKNPYFEDIFIADLLYNKQIGLILEKNNEYDKEEQFI